MQTDRMAFSNSVLTCSDTVYVLIYRYYLAFMI